MREVLGVVTIRFLAVTGNSCLHVNEILNSFLENERRRCEFVGGPGGIFPQKILKSSGLKMVFSAFSMRYFFKKKSTWINCKMTGTFSAYSNILKVL